LEASQEQIAYFPVKGQVSHRVGVMPNLIDHHTPAHPFYALPQIEVSGVKVGCHNSGQKIDPDHPQPFDQANLAAVQNYVRARLPQLDPTPFDVQSCLYTNTPDYHFILDRHPELPHVVIAAGFSGHGFKFGPILGQIMAALALAEAPPLSLAQFALNRFAELGTVHQRTNV
jgi:glycine/D-amino acid oxidase-like deaminating enzyme